MSPADSRELVAAALGGPEHPLAAWYGALLATRAPLHAFVTANAPKIRKKARHASDHEAMRDLRCELAVAAALADRRSPLVYEPLAAVGRRGPDFLLRHKGHSEVYVEVSRLRPARSHTSEATGQRARDPNERLAAVLCGKLSQLIAGSANLLVLVSDDGPFSADEVTAVIQSLRRRAEAKDDAFFAFRGLPGARAALQLLPRLSGVLVVAPPAADMLTLHAQARHPLPADHARAVARWGLGTIIGAPLNDGPPGE